MSYTRSMCLRKQMIVVRKSCRPRFFRRRSFALPIALLQQWSFSGFRVPSSQRLWLWQLPPQLPDLALEVCQAEAELLLLSADLAEPSQRVLDLGVRSADLTLDARDPVLFQLKHLGLDLLAAGILRSLPGSNPFDSTALVHQPTALLLASSVGACLPHCCLGAR